MKFHTPLLALLVLLGAQFSACAQANSPNAAPAGGGITVRVTEEVLVEAPRRLGATLAKTYYANDQQFAANPFAHGGFQPGHQAMGIRVANATANTIRDEGFNPNDPHLSYTESFAGGSYYIATGARAGESGRIVANAPMSGEFELEHTGAPLADNDYVWLRGPEAPRAVPDAQEGEQMLGIGDFRLEAETGVTHDFVPDPDDPGNQVLRLNFPPTGARMYGGAKHYIRATPNTTYHVTVRARSAMANANIGVNIQNLGIPGGEAGHRISFTPDGSAELGDGWRELRFTGTTYANSDIARNFSGVSVVIAANTSESAEGHAYLDKLRLEDESAVSGTGFIEPVVETLREARPGVLRFYGTAGLGSTVESITSAGTTDAPWTFTSLAAFFRFSSTDTVLDQWMQLSREVDALPWITVGSTNTPDDWYRLISYLAAPADFDADARRRASHGHSQPWLDAFDTIYLEIGNEWWNNIFRPYYLPFPDKYGELCRTIIQRVREHPHFDPDKIKIIAGGWAINAHHWNRVVDAASEGHDLISLAPYLLYGLDRFSTPEEKYGALFADVNSYQRGPAQNILRGMAENQKGTGLAVYELNTHTTTGAANAETVSELAPSIAAGVAVLDQAMSLMSTLQADPIVYFTLLQRHYQNRQGLWGNLVRTPQGDLRPRPVWHGLRLANHFLIDGPMVATETSGVPTWNQPENGSVAAMSDVPYLHAYAFRPGATPGNRGVNLLLINRHLERPLSVRVEVPFTPRPQARRITLSSRYPGDNNEEQEQVRLQEEDIAFEGAVTVPPFSAVVLQLREGGQR